MKKQICVCALVVVMVCATVSVHAGTRDGDSSRITRIIVNAERTSLRIIYGVGKERVERSKASGDTVGTPRISPDRRTVGWAVLRVDGASYPYPEWLQFVQRGVSRNLSCDQGMPWAWRFEGAGAVVLECAYPHGSGARWRELVDIRTKRILARFELPNEESAVAREPAWAKAPLFPSTVP